MSKRSGSSKTEHAGWNPAPPLQFSKERKKMKRLLFYILCLFSIPFLFVGIISRFAYQAIKDGWDYMERFEKYIMSYDE